MRVTNKTTNTLQTFLASKNPNDKSVFSCLVLSWSRFFMASEMANKNNNDKKLKLSVNLLLSRKRLLLQLLNSCEPLNYVFYIQQIAIITRKMVHHHHHPQLFSEILLGIVRSLQSAILILDWFGLASFQEYG